MNDNSSQSPQADAAEAVRADIEHTRHQLGQTVDALAAKTDVKARAQEKVSEFSANLPEPAQQAAARASSFVRKYPGQLAAAFAALAALIVLKARRSR
jgi:Protein of unknown function (DUF3618)